MLSRVADTIYWLARYAERTQAMLQVIRTGYIASQNELSEYSWAPLLHRYGDLGADEVAALAGRTQPALHHLVLDKGNGASAYTNILRGRENARAVQDHISKEVWQALNDYYHAMRSPEVTQQLAAGDPISGIDLLLRNSLIFTGAVKNTMARGEGYVYLHLGKYLERALQTADTLRNRWAAIAHDAHHPLESSGLRYLLYSLFGYEQYMKTYKGNFNPANVLHLALYSPEFSHSLLYSLQQLHQYFRRLQAASLPESYARLEFLLGRTLGHLRYSTFTGEDPDALLAFLDQIRRELLAIAAALNQYYFGN